MNSSAIIGSQELDSMDSLPPEREFLSLQVARNMSNKVQSEDRGLRVSDGISVSLAGISVEHAMPCSSPVSSVSMAISKSDSEMNEVKQAVTVLASSNICCEGLNSDAFGCHMDSDSFIPIELRNVQFSNFNAQESEVTLLQEDRIPRQGGLLDVTVQQECHPRVNQWTQQSPPRSVDVVPTSDTRPGLSKEHVDGPKGISWSSVVTKNILRGVGFNQQQGHQSPACDKEIPFFKGIPLKPASNSSATPAQEGNSNQLLQEMKTQQRNQQ
ncbi:hypothetical protein Nepgr_007823 [Nepenthes gracilis]|uniref:Uncharacterized protein n=1 Tax=Nepenthes gracilis TaxID=150966 RepID=A0AAD3XIN4_NEPGR|nr:hypothetical protein Nepgr_007823 [Nepenthes gracilis]